MIRRAVILFCLALPGCAATPQQQSVEPGSEITLAPGATVAVKGKGFKVRFVAVTHDSRCPKDTTCIWAGEVKAQIDILKISQTWQVELPEGGNTAIDDHRVTLVRVEPQPTSTARIAPEDYRATLKID
jgi:hypothetical protein